MLKCDLCKEKFKSLNIVKLDRDEVMHLCTFCKISTYRTIARNKINKQFK